MSQLDTIAISQVFEVVWKLVRAGHLGTVYQNRNDRDITPQGGSGFDANEIRGIVETTCSAFVPRREPYRAHHDQEHATLGDAFFNRFTEIAPRFDAGYVHEYRLFAKVMDKVVKQTASLSLRVTPSIADKDGAQRRLP
jgi:hypothetical protein